MFNLPASMGLTDILSLAIAAILVNNYILVQFLGCCSFFGVSKKTDTALGMGMAVIFVMAIASAASWAVQYLSFIHIEMCIRDRYSCAPSALRCRRV